MRNIYLILLSLCFLCGCSFNKRGETDVNFKSITKDTVCYLYGDADTSKLIFHLDVEIPDETTSLNLSKSFQTSILKCIVGFDVHDLSSEDAICQYLSKWANDYQTMQQMFSVKDTLSDGYDAPESYNWKVNVKGNVLFKNNDILSYLVETNKNTGKANYKIQNAVNIKIQSGNVIILEDIFTDDYAESLLPSLISQLKSDNKLSDSDDLESIGFFNDEDIFVSRNFLLDCDGITFIYNPGEIAANVIGSVSVKLPYDAITFAVKDNSPIKDLIK